ncbi:MULTISPECIES: hypothetical protein [unclassified Streptomyces]|uniref:hypothetical protein n=1 Tax=unclassified Streptomyces TaxID=2593676 RepID=UPI000378DBE2|nr:MULTISPECIES: hypothetical protein [unclassified Streptomyces]MYQ77640.1 hypothetical protein [Streptomyces sp. SID4923]
MKLGKILGVTAGAAALALTFSTQAMAADYSVSTDDGDPGGKMSATLYGDIITVKDQEADGWGVKGWVFNSSGGVVYTLQAGGNGNTATGRASMGGKYNLTEGAKYKLRVCLHKENKDAYCDDSSYFKNDH